MKVGFNTDADETKEPEVGAAEISTEDDFDWFDFLMPKVVDFLLVYGAVSFTKDVIEYIKPKGGD